MNNIKFIKFPERDGDIFEYMCKGDGTYIIGKCLFHVNKHYCEFYDDAGNVTNIGYGKE